MDGVWERWRRTNAAGRTGTPHTILSFTDPFSASHTHYCPDHAVALKHVLIHTQFKLFEEKRQVYVMVNKMKHEWRERTPVRTQYLYIRPLQCDAGSHFEHLHNCAVLYIQTDSIEDEPYADKLVTEGADKWVSFNVNVKKVWICLLLFDNTAIINELKMLISNLEVTMFFPLLPSITDKHTLSSLILYLVPLWNASYYKSKFGTKSHFMSTSSLYILVYFPVFSTSCSLIDALLFVEPLQHIKEELCKERHVLVRCSATTGSRHVLATSLVPFPCYYVSVFMKWKGV